MKIIDIIFFISKCLPCSSLQEKAFVVDLDKRDGGLGLSVSVSD